MKGPNEQDARARIVLYATWMLLVALTIGSSWLSESDGFTASVAIRLTLGAALVKGHLIAAIYMEMRSGPIVWAMVMSGFLIFQSILLVTILP